VRQVIEQQQRQREWQWKTEEQQWHNPDGNVLQRD
jgi:hypothetical protein